LTYKFPAFATTK